VINKKETIFEALLHRILFMHYPPGAILNETSLAKEFGTSRGPLREVLKQLEWKKLVVTMPRLGIQVTEIDFQKVIQTFQIRFDLESLAARLACENASQAYIDRIGTLIETLNGGLDRDLDGELAPDPGIHLIKIDIQFRDILYEAAQNPILKEISDYLYHITLRINLLAHQKGDFQRCKPLFLEEMRAFQEAFAGGEVEAAGEIRQRYMKAYLVGVKSLF
jgi:DNA-binding GntR family transcriptional regulator